MDFQTQINSIKSLIEGVEKLNPHQARQALLQIEAFLNQMYNEIRQLQGLINNHLAEIAGLNQVNNSRLIQIEQLNTQIRNLTGENENLQNQLNQLKNRDNTLVEEIVRRIVGQFAASMNNSIETGFKNLNQQLQIDNRTVKNAELTVKQLNDAINDLKRLIFEKMDQIWNNASNEIIDIKRILNHLDNRLNDITNEISQLKELQENNIRRTREMQNYLIDLNQQFTRQIAAFSQRVTDDIANSKIYFNESLKSTTQSILNAMESNNNVLLGAINRITSCNCKSYVPQIEPKPISPRTFDSFRAFINYCWFYGENFCIFLLFSVIITFFILILGCVLKFICNFNITDYC
jgi:chromosome segregation ATPase